VTRGDDGSAQIGGYHYLAGELGRGFFVEPGRLEVALREVGEDQFAGAGFSPRPRRLSCSPATLGSHGFDLLRWFRFLHGRWMPWEGAERNDVREFVEWLQETPAQQRLHLRPGVRVTARHQSPEKASRAAVRRRRTSSPRPCRSGLDSDETGGVLRTRRCLRQRLPVGAPIGAAREPRRPASNVELVGTHEGLPSRLLVDSHRATTQVLRVECPFLAEGGLGSTGTYIGSDVFI
jgi:hypothetical protein